MTKLKWKIIPFESQYELAVTLLKQEIQTEYSEPIFSKKSLSLTVFSDMPTHHYWVLLIDEALAGVVGVIYLNDHEAELKRFYLKKEYRGSKNGFAKALLDQVLNWCNDNSIDNLYLGTISVLKAAQKFYQKNEFEKVEKESLPQEVDVFPMDNVFYRRVLGKNI